MKYLELKPWELEPDYSQHVSAMTEEGLDSKGAIAEQLAWRDRQLSAALAKVTELEGLFQRTHGCHWSWPHKVTELEQENARLRREVEDVLTLDLNGDASGIGHVTSPVDGDPRGSHMCCFSATDGPLERRAAYGNGCAAARRAAVEYLKAKEKP